MDADYSLGIYKYKSKIATNQLNRLPNQLRLDYTSACGVLMQLILGKVYILDREGNVLFNQKINYTKIPAQREKKHTYKQFADVLDIDVFDETSCNVCDRFLIFDRKNNFIYEHILNELTQYFVCINKSSCEAFVHLYRTLEFMSYSFPLIYASKSKDYRGSYDSLKKLMSGDGAGELKFFDKFVKELFVGDISYNYEFEVFIDCTNLNDLKTDFYDIFKTDFFVFSGNTITFKFKSTMELFIGIRNRYFHMLLGQGKNNFLNMDYNKNDLFSSLNPVFVNWITIIFTKIIQHGLETFVV